MSVDEIQAWMSSYLSRLLKIRPEQVDIGLPFDNYGLDSRSAAAMVGDLAALLDRELELGIVYDHPSIEQLSLHLAGRHGA